MIKCYIFGACPINNYDYINLDNNSDNIIICADGGIKHAEKLGIDVDFFIGDMDSSDFNKNAKNIIKYNTIKNDTDMMLAVKKAIELKCNEIHIYGGIGGRLDHTYANFQVLSYILDQKCKGFLYDENTMITMINDKFVFDKIKYKFISLFSYSDNVLKVTIKGLKYEINKLNISNNFPIGISNEYINNIGEVEIKKGKLIIIMCNE